jgi:ethanolamine kinase
MAKVTRNRCCWRNVGYFSSYFRRFTRWRLIKNCKKVFALIQTSVQPFFYFRRTKLFPPTAQLRQEFDELYAHLETLGNQLVFCHNDLLLGNIIHSETAEKITFIDYEYAAVNFQAFDIGNHFTEYAGIDNIDYKRYPEKAYQLNWLRVYLETFESRPVTDEEIERLYVHVQKFALASHFLWFLWALIQAEHSTIDFDFLRFGEQRFNEYRARKAVFLALTTSP